MKNSFFIIFFAVIISLVSSQYILSQVTDSFSSQDSSAKKKSDINSLKKGFWSIQFAINSNFTLGNFDDATLSLKRHLSSHSALRIGFNGNYSLEKNDTNDVIRSGNSYFGVNLIYMYYINPSDNFNIYGFAGGKYSYSGFLSQNIYGYDKADRWEAGALTGIGTEYFIFRKLSLFAEYSYIFNFGKVKNISANYTDKYENSRSITTLKSENVKFGLAVYFSF